MIGSLLAFKAQRFLKSHSVQVIGVTGSIGKTSTKEAIYTVLKRHFDVYSSQKSFNTEFGLSLAVLQEAESGFSSPLAWLRILRRVLFQKKKPYRKIILEMGSDKPGDIRKLIRIAPPHIGVVTNVNAVHIAEGQFKNLEAIAKEKGNIVRHLPKGGVAILNEDDPYVRVMETSAAKFTYGVKAHANLRADQLHATSKHLSFDVFYQGQTEKFRVPVIGEFQVYVLLPAIAVGIQMGLSLKDCSDALADFRLPPGRMNPIAGIEGTQIIDSSYNASPKTMETALSLLAELKAQRKVAVLGTMNELGEASHESHILLGKKAAEVARLLIAVGKEAQTIKRGALEAGMNKEAIFTFFDSEAAGAALKGMLKRGDLILVKGSQNNVRMERLVKMLMKDRHKAGLLLCRQGAQWQKF